MSRHLVIDLWIQTKDTHHDIHIGRFACLESGNVCLTILSFLVPRSISSILHRFIRQGNKEHTYNHKDGEGTALRQSMETTSKDHTHSNTDPDAPPIPSRKRPPSGICPLLPSDSCEGPANTLPHFSRALYRHASSDSGSVPPVSYVETRSPSTTSVLKTPPPMDVDLSTEGGPASRKNSASSRDAWTGLSKVAGAMQKALDDRVEAMRSEVGTPYLRALWVS